MLLKERFLNGFVDLSFIALLMFALDKVYPSVYFEKFELINERVVQTQSYEAVANRDFVVSVLGILIFILYYFLLEFFYKRTFGKFLTGTVVISMLNRRPSVRQILIRSLSRLVPFEVLSIVFSDVMWHDKWSGTRVVKKSSSDLSVPQDT